jgi:hypothetical protein
MLAPAQRRNLSLWLYVALCAAVLVFLGAANARGYVPFAGRQTKSSEHTANHFHK